MKSARLIWLGLLAFLALAVLLVIVFVSPPRLLAPTRVAENASPSPQVNSTGATPSDFSSSAAETLSPSAATTAEPTAAPTSDVPDLPAPTISANASDAFNQAVTLRRDGDYVRAATAFRSVVQDSSDPALTREAQFRLGEALYLAADFTNALPALTAVVSGDDTDALAARAHYFLGDIYTQQQNYDKALEQLKIYRQRTKALAGVIDREIGDVLLASGDDAAAIQQYQTSLQDPTFTADQKVTVLEKIADVYTSLNKPADAAKQLSAAFQIAPDDATRAAVEYLWGLALSDANDAAGAVTHWKHALATYPATSGAHDAVAKMVELGTPNINDLQRGIANYAVGNYDLAIQAFRRYLNSTKTPGAEALYYAGMSYLRNGDNAGAQRNFDALLQSYPKDKRVPDALYNKAIAQIRQGATTASLGTLRQLVKQYPADTRADDGFWTAALAFEGAGNYASAASVYSELASTFPASGYAPAAVFNAGLNDFLTQNYAKAQANWQAALKKYPDSDYADASAYWLGKLAKQQGDPQTATQYFQQATTAPRSFYSWRAFDALNQPAPPPSYDLKDYELDDSADARAELEQWIATWSTGTVSADLPPTVLNNASFKRGSEYASLSRAIDARPQFLAVNETFAKNAAALYALALYYKDNNYFSLSIDAAARLAALSGKPETAQPHLLRQLTFPTYYADLVVPYAQKHNFDPTLFFGLIRQESNYNPQAYSSADARGLTQVIPDTGDYIARALGVKDFTQSDLFKPYISVRFGTYYLGSVLDSFNGNVFYGLIGYNGGPGNARKWQQDDIDTAIESVPYPETNLYVRTVYDQYREYVDIYRDGGK